MVEVVRDGPLMVVDVQQGNANQHEYAAQERVENILEGCVMADRPRLPTA